MLVLLSIVSIMSLVGAQYTCPPYQVGTAISGTGLGGVNGLYQATSLAQCCYNCLVVFSSTCAGFTYNAQQGTCFLASSIQYYQNNMGSAISSGVNSNFAAAATTSSSNTATTTTTTTASTSSTTVITSTTGSSGVVTSTSGQAAAGTAPTTTTSATTASTTTVLANCFVSFNTSLVGNDLFQLLATSAVDCCNKCAASVTAAYKCVGFVYQSSTNICSLKTVDPTTSPNININAGNDFTSGTVNVASGR